MKDIAKFAGTTLLLLLTLTLVSLVFIQSFMGDYEWLNIALTVVYSLAVLAAMAVMTFAVNDRASRVDMPAPDNTFGIYHVTN